MHDTLRLIAIWIYFPIMMIDIIINEGILKNGKWSDFYADDPMSI